MTIWAILFAGVQLLFAHGRAPTADPDGWPEASALAQAPDRPTLVLFVDPDDPRAQADLAALARLVARAPRRVAAFALFVRPSGAPEVGPAAAAVPGVRAIVDRGGALAELFGAGGSGHAALYAADGRLLVRGGIASLEASILAALGDGRQNVPVICPITR